MNLFKNELLTQHQQNNFPAARSNKISVGTKIKFSKDKIITSLIENLSKNDDVFAKGSNTKSS